MTKKRLFKNISILFCEEPAIDVPARYARNPGMMGNTQGDKKEIIPAIKAIPKDAKEKLSILFLLYNH